MRKFLLALSILALPAGAAAETRCPDGSYVAGTECYRGPDGHYYASRPELAPAGGYVAGRARLAPDGRYVGGEGDLIRCPDGSYVAGKTCRLMPNGHYIGE